MILAAPVVRKPLAEIGFPGMTDFCKIYIASELNAQEYRTTLRHEQAHVWTGHNRRRPKDCRDREWRTACEMEIARNIYDDRDIATIKAPRSRLLGAYLPDSIPGMPEGLTIAEDIYQWLLDNPDPQLGEVSICKCVSSHTGKEEGSASSISIAEAREKLDDEEREAASQAAAKSSYEAILKRAPSLTEAIDAALRHRIVSEPSYRRPARRGCGDVILKGRISTPRPPLVEIFVDRSGSFTPDKTRMAESCLRHILIRYGASIRSDTWFFGNGRLLETDVPGGGDTPYNLIGEHLCLSRPKLAIVITDDDPVGSISVPPVDVICVPIGCGQTKLATSMGGRDVLVLR